MKSGYGYARAERLGYYAAVCANAAPLWLADFPPLVDLPQHAAQAATFLRLLDAHSPLHAVLEIHLFTPYLVGYLLIAALAQAMSIVAATKVVLTLAVIAFPLSCSVLRREAGGDPRWDWLTLPLVFSVSWKLGFLNFLVGAPLALLYTALCLRHIREPSRATAWGLFAGGVVLFLCHALLFLFFAGLALVMIAAECGRPRAILARARPVLFAFPLALPLVLSWIRVTVSGETSSTTDFNWAVSPLRLIKLFSIPYLGPDYLWPTSTFQFTMALAVLSLPLICGARLRPWRQLLPFFGFCVLFMLLPLEWGDAAIIYPRFAMFMVPFYLASLLPRAPSAEEGAALRATHRVALAAMICFALSYPLAYGQKFREFSARSVPFLEVLDRMAPDRTVLYLALDRETANVSYAYLHYPVWYQALKGGIVDVNFAALSHMLVRFKPGHRPALPENFEFRPDFDWRANQGWRYDYFVVLAKEDPSVLFREADCPVRQVSRSGMWWLYERDWGQAGEPGSCAAKYRRG